MDVDSKATVVKSGSVLMDLGTASREVHRWCDLMFYILREAGFRKRGD